MPSLLLIDLFVLNNKFPSRLLVTCMQRLITLISWIEGYSEEKHRTYVNQFKNVASAPRVKEVKGKYRNYCDTQ